jgi:hypothetical protein
MKKKSAAFTALFVFWPRRCFLLQLITHAFNTHLLLARYRSGGLAIRHRKTAIQQLKFKGNKNDYDFENDGSRGCFGRGYGGPDGPGLGAIAGKML